MKYGPFAKELRTLGKLEIKYLREVFKRGRMSIFYNDGGMVDRFQDAFAKYTGATRALARNNGMCALAEAVTVSGAGVGTEILCDPVVHFGGLAAVYYNTIPRFVDIDPETYLMDPDALEAAITPRSRAVICTHLWGLPARIDRIRDICRKHKLFLIEDCAHGMGAKWKGRHVGTFGDLGMFSFQEFKQLSTGDGAMTTVADPELAEKMENVWAFSGESPKIMTLNWRMNEMTAAVGLAQLEKQDGILAYYGQTLKLLNDAIKGCPWLKPRLVPAEATQSGYWFACTWQGDRHGLSYERFKALNEKLKIGLRFGFNHTAPYDFPLFKSGDFYGQGCPFSCPYYKEQNGAAFRQARCPNVEEVMPRLITVNLIFFTHAAAGKMVEKLSRAIELMNKG